MSGDHLHFYQTPHGESMLQNVCLKWQGAGNLSPRMGCIPKIAPVPLAFHFHASGTGQQTKPLLFLDEGAGTACEKGSFGLS